MRSVLVAGDTLRDLVSLAAYPASAGWTLSYRLTPRAAGTAITFSGSASGEQHLVLVAAGTTADWTAGEYTCSAWVSNAGGERYTVESECGQVTIRANPASLPAGTDTRSEAERAYAAVVAMISGRASDGIKSYEIAGRRLERYSLAELLRLRDQLRADVNGERAAAGLPPLADTPRSQRVLVRCR